MPLNGTEQYMYVNARVVANVDEQMDPEALMNRQWTENQIPILHHV